jgi:uncharacterized cupin superfamily protein
VLEAESCHFTAHIHRTQSELHIISGSLTVRQDGVAPRVIQPGMPVEFAILNPPR